MKNSFSQRLGLTPIKSIIQIDSMDHDLENGLWNILTDVYWDNFKFQYVVHAPEYIIKFLREIWGNFLKRRLDEMPSFWNQLLGEIKQHYFTCVWYEKYDLLEFIKETSENIAALPNIAKVLVAKCNILFEKELSGFRFVGGTLSPIITTEEIQSIEDVLKIGDKFSSVKEHFNRSLQLLSDRSNPDYRNSIKESISAVEALCVIITGQPKTTLGQALRIIGQRHKIHEALKSSLSNLYGFTSDASGIRHALLEEPMLQQEDALFMLVLCSAFTNYLIKKTE